MNVIINVWGAYWRTYAHSHRQARTQKESASMKKVTSVFGVYNSIANNLSLVSLAVPSVKEEKIQNDSIEYDKRTNVSILQHARKMANLLLAHPKGLGEGVRSVENLFFESNSSFRNMKREKRNSVTAARVEKWNSLGELKQPLLFFFRISLKLKIFYLSKKKKRAKFERYHWHEGYRENRKRGVKKNDEKLGANSVEIKETNTKWWTFFLLFFLHSTSFLLHPSTFAQD